MLALSFLLLIGTTLIADGIGFHVPKGYIYAAIGFSVMVEALNQVAAAPAAPTPGRLPAPLLSRRRRAGRAGTRSDRNAGDDAPQIRDSGDGAVAVLKRLIDAAAAPRIWPASVPEGSR